MFWPHEGRMATLSESRVLQEAGSLQALRARLCSPKDRMVRGAAGWDSRPCLAWLRLHGQRNGAENSSACVDIYELRVTFAELHRDVVSNLDRLMQDWKTIVLDRGADKIMSRSIKQLKIQAWCYVWTSDPVSTEMSTAHQFSCLLVWKPAAQHEVVRWQESIHVDVHWTSAELVCSSFFLFFYHYYFMPVFVLFCVNKKERN